MFEIISIMKHIPYDSLTLFFGGRGEGGMHKKKKIHLRQKYVVWHFYVNGK